MWAAVLICFIFIVAIAGAYIGLMYVIIKNEPNDTEMNGYNDYIDETKYTDYD